LSDSIPQRIRPTAIHCDRSSWGLQPVPPLETLRLTFCNSSIAPMASLLPRSIRTAFGLGLPSTTTYYQAPPISTRLCNAIKPLASTTGTWAKTESRNALKHGWTYAKLASSHGWDTGKLLTVSTLTGGRYGLNKFAHKLAALTDSNTSVSPMSRPSQDSHGNR
jgi:hypothetical protein